MQISSTEELTRKIDMITAGVYKYLNRQLREEISKENSTTIANYVLAQKTEVNLADTYRVNILTTLITLSLSLKNKQFKNMIKDDIISYLDTNRKSEDLDPLHRWIGSYNEKRQRLVKFFRWLYNPNQQPTARITPDFMKNIPKLKRKEISIYKPTDLWRIEKRRVVTPLICCTCEAEYYLIKQNIRFVRFV
ncbi:MAG: hypothetical protein M3Y53_10925 [Thermoproteota archaeon]|nr:hypothetical protein [Thermoproteota archaeon]